MCVISAEHNYSIAFWWEKHMWGVCVEMVAMDRRILSNVLHPFLHNEGKLMHIMKLCKKWAKTKKKMCMVGH